MFTDETKTESTTNNFRIEDKTVENKNEYN